MPERIYIVQTLPLRIFYPPLYFPTQLADGILHYKQTTVVFMVQYRVGISIRHSLSQHTPRFSRVYPWLICDIFEQNSKPFWQTGCLPPAPAHDCHRTCAFPAAAWLLFPLVLDLSLFICGGIVSLARYILSSTSPAAVFPSLSIVFTTSGTLVVSRTDS